ncbi:MAG: PIN domain nuclease [Coriobacteriia bacterium]
MIQAISRYTLVIGGLLGGFAVTRIVDLQSELGLPRYYVIFLLIILGGAIGYVLGGIVGRELTTAWLKTQRRYRQVASADLLLGIIGVVIGLGVALLASAPLRLMKPEWISITVSVLLMITLSYISARIALSRRRDFTAYFPRLAPAKPETVEERAVLLDTSAVIDGRFVDLHRLGFMPGILRVPRFVLAELQTLADSSDDNRRARGRRGLDLLASLPAEIPVAVFEADYADTAQVDDKLMRLAVDAKSAIVTVDYNLAKVARVRGIEVLNLNDAASALRPTYLPGESIHLRISKPGKEAEQGVGHLDDGTMVVVQGGRSLVGKDSDVEVTSVLQTSAGRMIFARTVERTSAQESGDSGADDSVGGALTDPRVPPTDAKS